MRILMMTNTFTPHVGGVARSVQSFTEAFRRAGHEVLVAAPLFKGVPASEPGVIRFPAFRNFNGSSFAIPMPEPLRLVAALKPFQPQVVHSHHPFLLGGTALRVAAARGLPLVFTHHTFFDQYTHYLPGDSPAMRRFAQDFVTGYCNLCDAVIAPSKTVADLLRSRDVHRPIRVIPTGIDTRSFKPGDRRAARERLGIPSDAWVVGHVGRLVLEKNLLFLADAVARFLLRQRSAYFLLVGDGPLKAPIAAVFESAGLAARFRAAGVLENAPLADAYRAMDAFAFASHTETQGMVLLEAMATGVPVVAVAASGVRELVRDGYNGRLLKRDDPACFAAALEALARQTTEAREAMRNQSQATADALDIRVTAAQTLDLYDALTQLAPSSKRLRASPWAAAFRRLRGEWQLFRNVMKAAGESLRPSLLLEVEVASAAPAPASDGKGIKLSRVRTERKHRLLGWVWAWLLRVQSATWRKRQEGLEALDALLAERRKVLFCFWHGRYLPLFALLRGRPACVFTSQSDRGRVIAEICRNFGYGCVLVPARNQGQAYELMQRALEQHQNGGIAVDGPLGPFHRVKRGAIKLASELGYIVVPASATARRKRVIVKRWDRMEFPGWFTHVGLAIGTPMEIPEHLSVEDTQRWAARVRTALEQLDQRAEALAGIVAEPDQLRQPDPETRHSA
ncbi:MAG: glycosyltransferase [Gammaproteobacteria bacterium]